ncbi:hypothetical protein CROQUDRAFT_665139 [Cronartium quercuum f. sp. fusiforme G11]|uniref:protein-histidine N-methyltransferase n=1 Tax=Cronartium quercuum f. sp. fusiforme G11 TaxID=708437 RepID=A0A9P6NAJ3_9BASI|nr:hypothetical protein CROQUDRAFT_665139 [Cronartium quercuum f. sp. fusiforme G11]
MFKFDFDLKELEAEVDDPASYSTSNISALKISDENPTRDSDSTDSERECHEIALKQLLESLPPFLSYSTIEIPGPTEEVEASIWRRDLYDAKYQTYLDPEDQTNSDSEEEKEEDQTPERLTQESEKKRKATAKTDRTKDPTRSNDHLQNLLTAPSDLLPGVYEGGFKTWESSLDLIRYFSRTGIHLTTRLKDPKRKETMRLLEVGCGTALPTVWLLYKLFYDLIYQDHLKNQNLQASSQSNEPSRVAQPLEFYLQDFNEEVLYLLTLPNIILAFHRASQLALANDNPDSESNQTEVEPSGDLELTADLKTRFVNLLERHHLQLRFFHGPWRSFLRTPSSSNQFELIYSSETIYSPITLPSLVSLFARATASPPSKTTLTQLLVAAKKVYFGVGGSSFEFVRQIEALGGQVHTVWPTESDDPESLGVGRLIMSVTWPGHS